MRNDLTANSLEWWELDLGNFLQVALFQISELVPVVPHVRWRKSQNRKPMGELGCCESRQSESTDGQKGGCNGCSDDLVGPQLLDVVWCSAAAVVVAM
jgi:hypothetical protein